MSDYRTFVVPYDFSEHARAALDVAADLARRMRADLHLVHVVPTPSAAYDFGPYGGAAMRPPTDMAALTEGAMESLGKVIAEIDVPGTVEPLAVGGTNIAAMLTESAENLGADLIVMGTHGRTGMAHVFLGSVAERVLRTAPCPVVTVRAQEEGNVG